MVEHLTAFCNAGDRGKVIRHSSQIADLYNDLQRVSVSNSPH